MYCPNTRLSHVTPDTARAGLDWMRLALVLCLSSFVDGIFREESNRSFVVKTTYSLHR